LLLGCIVDYFQRSKAVLKQPQSRRFARTGRHHAARSVWTACGSPPLLPAHKPATEEIEDAKGLELARIAFNFNRRDCGRLRQMINVLNWL